MKKYLLIIMISLVVGFLLSYYMLKEYDNIVLPTFGGNGQTVYLVQQGVYSNMDSMNSNTSKLTDYIYSQVDGMYYVYVGITLSKENASKIQNYYTFDTVVKTTTMSNNEYLKTLTQLDSILSGSEDKDAIKAAIKEGLQKYQGG